MINRVVQIILISVVFFSIPIARAQQWSYIAPMKHGRVEPKCAELKDGRVMVAGGFDQSGMVNECEIYDPRTNSWSSGGTLKQGRYRYSLIALDNGKILAMGGLTDLSVATTSSCELYDPSTNSWTLTQRLPIPSENVASMRMADGRIFVAGGLNANTGKYLDMALIFDPATEKFTQLPNSGIGRTGLLLYQSPSQDTLMICGGEFDGFYGYYLRSTSLFSLKANMWMLGDSSAEPHDNSQIMAIQMPDQKPLLISGRSGSNKLTQNVESYDWNTGKWSQIGQLKRAQWHCYAFRIGDDSIVVTGGSTPDYQNVSPHTTWYQYSNGHSWTGPELNTARYLYTGLVVNKPVGGCSYHQEVYVFGGADDQGGALNSCEVLDLGVKGNGITPNATQHLELFSGVVGNIIDMPLAVDLLDTAGIKAMWGSLTSVSGTFSYDSSRVYFNSIVPAAGWSLASVNDNGKNVQFTVKNQSAAYSTPLDVASAQFKIHDTTKGMTRIILNDLTLHTTTDQTLCLSQTEDALWGIVVKPVASVDDGSTEGPEGPEGPEGALIRYSPNPFGDHIRVSGNVESVVMYDLLGHRMDIAMTKELNGFDVATKSLAIGTYFVVCNTPEGVKTIRVVK